MDTVEQCGILTREDVGNIKDLDGIVNELEELLKSNEFIESAQERVKALVENFLDFVRDQDQEYLKIPCGTLSLLRKSGKISHSTPGSLRSTIIEEKKKRKENGRIIEVLSPQEIHDFILENRENPEVCLEIITPHLITTELVWFNTLKELLIIVSQASKISSQTLQILLELFSKCNEVTFKKISPILSKARLNKRNLDLAMQIGDRDLYCYFDDLLPLFQNAIEIEAKSLAMLTRIAVEETECADVSNEIGELAVRFGITISKNMEDNLNILKQREL